MDTQLSQHHLLKRLYSPSELSLQCCWKSIDHKCMGLFLDSQFFSIVYVSILNASSTQSWPLQLKFWNWKMWVLQLFSSFSRLFWLLWIPCIFLWILGSSCQFLQKAASGIVIEIVLNVKIYLGSITIFQSINISVFLFIWVFLSFFHQCFVVFSVQGWYFFC